MRREALKVLRPGRSVKAKFAKFCLNRNDDQYMTSMYCEAQVNSEPIILILDSGYSGCIVSAGFLKKAGIQIDRLSTVMMVGVHGEQKRPIGEIDRFPITSDVPRTVLYVQYCTYCTYCTLKFLPIIY